MCAGRECVCSVILVVFEFYAWLDLCRTSWMNFCNMIRIKCHKHIKMSSHTHVSHTWIAHSTSGSWHRHDMATTVRESWTMAKKFARSEMHTSSWVIHTIPCDAMTTMSIARVCYQSTEWLKNENIILTCVCTLTICPINSSNREWLLIWLNVTIDGGWWRFLRLLTRNRV